MIRGRRRPTHENGLLPVRIVVLSGPSLGLTWELGAAPCVLGRSAGADMTVATDSHMSRRHCRIILVNSSCWLEDLDTPNGTWLRERRLSQGVHLEPRAIFRAGDTSLCILHDGDNVWKGGTIYDPEEGKTYRCKMTLTDVDILRVRGFIGISLLGRTTVWKRVVETEESP